MVGPLKEPFMTATTDTLTAMPATPVPRIWQVLALILTAIVLIQNGILLYGSAGGPGGAGTIGTPHSDIVCGTDHFCPMPAILPDSPAARAGIVAGDGVRYDQPYDAYRAIRAGEVIGLTVRHGDTLRHVVLTADAYRLKPIPSFVAETIVGVLLALAGGLVILRSGTRPAVLLIGLAYVCYAMPGSYPRLWESARPLYVPVFIFLCLAYFSAFPLFLAAALSFRREMTGKDAPVLRAVFWLFTALLAVLVLIQLYTWLLATSFPLVGDGYKASGVFLLTALPLTALVLALGWKDVPAQGRTRYAFMLAAILVTMIAPLCDAIITATSNDYRHFSPLVILWLSSMLTGTLLFAYAILRHKVIDLGFAINRTLVYGIVSVVLLLGFGVIEWASEKFIPIQSREKNLFVDAAIALGIFLTFHRVRDFVEHHIEGIFFHRWHQNEAALNRFVADAGYITRPEALITATVAEFRRFSGGAEAALYLAEGDGYARRDGGLSGAGERLDGNLPALVRLRSTHQPVQGDEGSGLHAELILPMSHRSEVLGAVLIGPKPDGGGYRPDERSALFEAAHKIGLDLHALRVEALEDQVSRLSHQLDHSDAQLRDALAKAR